MDIEATSDEITEFVQEDPNESEKAVSEDLNLEIEENDAANNRVLKEKKPKKASKKRKKSSATSRKKKKSSEANIEEPEINKIEESGLENQEVACERAVACASAHEVDVMEGNTTNSNDPMPMGQARVNEVKVKVLSNNHNSLMSTDNNGEEPAVTKLDAMNTQSRTLSTSTKVETTQSAILPFSAIKVRNVVGKVINIVTEIIPNKVIIQGTIHEQVFFVGADGIVHHLADDAPFSTFVDLPGAQAGMNAQVFVIIEDIIAELASDGLSILKKIILEIFVKVTETVQLNLLPGNGPVLFLKEVVGENTAQTLIETDVTLFTPAIKVDEITGSIVDATAEVIKDKVIIQGILHKQIFFIDNANLGRHQTEDIPFSTFVDIPGAVPGMDVQIHPNIEALFFNLISPTVIRQKAVLEFFVKVTENIQQAVSIGNGPLFKVEELIGTNTVQQLSETFVTLSLPAIKVREIVVKILDITTHIIENKVIVQGTIHKQIFFIGTDNIEHHQAEDVPFSLFLDIPGAISGDNVHISTIIEAVFFELVSNDELRQKVVFAVTATVTREKQLNLVLGTGPLFKLEKVVGENTKQILVVRREQIIPPVSPITVTKVTVVSPGARVIGRQQIIVNNTVQLPVKAIKVKEIKAILIDITARIVSDGVLVQGTIQKTVFFVDTENIVRSISEDVPFSILVNIPDISPSEIITVNVNLEDIIFSLNASGTAVNQAIVLEATVESETPPSPPITVVTDVSGPGIVQTKVLVQGLVLTPDGPVFQQFEVVTDVSGPGILNVVKQTVLLQRVGEPAPAPITVVTDVQVA